MKLTNINSSQLLPRFAAESKWLCDAFDELVKAVNTRTESLPAPLTIESIERLTDEELQAFYEQFGLVIYYPDISRDRRNWLLFQVYKYWVSLGTKKAVETLVQYIFDNVTVHIKVYDNLAYGVNGTIIHPELLDMFDVEVLPLSEGLPDNATARILANILIFSPNSQTLRDLWYTMPDNDLSVSACIGLPYGSCGVENVENYTICENVQPAIVEHTGYVGQLHNNNYSIQSGFFVKDASNNTILYDENKVYTFVALYMADGQEPDNYTKANCSIIGNPESQGNPKKLYAVIDHTGFQTIGCYCIYTTQDI